MDNLRFIFAIAAVVLVMLLLRSRARTRKGAYIDRDSPMWSEAAAKARGSVPVLRELFAAKAGPVAVKYPLASSGGDTEHVWGELLAIDQTTFRATLETPMLAGSPAIPGPYQLPLSALEDWQVTLPDGTIRGGYTTQVEIALARQAGRPIPRHIADLEGRFADV
jgi:hypothetical protein